MTEEPESEVFSLELLSALIDAAIYASELVDAIIDGKPKARAIRNLLSELETIENHRIGDLETTAGSLLEATYDRVELRERRIWLYEKADSSEKS